MSGIEVVGILLAFYPVVIDGLKLCKAVSSGQGITLLCDDLKNEELRYTEFLGLLFGQDVVREEQKRLKDNMLPALKQYPRQQLNLERRLGKAKAELVISTLRNMHEVLQLMSQDIDKAKSGSSLVR
jgi:hypothetical protein